MALPRVIVADDHAIVAEGLASLLAGRVTLLTTVHDGAALVTAIRELQPDVVITDISMPGMSGLDALAAAREIGSPAKFIFLTIHDEPKVAARAIAAGASAYLLKQAAGRELLSAIGTVVRGGRYVTPLVDQHALPAGTDTRALTTRQIDVVRLVALGKRMKDVAEELGISVRTAEGYKYGAMQALGIDSSAELVRYAIRRGLVAG